MKPIDGEKLIKEINNHIEIILGAVFTSKIDLGTKLKNGIESGKFNLPPGMIIIQRDSNYKSDFDREACAFCFLGNYICGFKKYENPCKGFIPIDEFLDMWKNAYIIGGNEK